jgi:peptidoglycan/xylan/chitin deacetylase (PgdA/CDA1 family)
MLRCLGYQGRSVRQAMPELTGTSNRRTVVLTFDDGYADVFENALPILVEFGFTATCYFVSRSLGRHNSWDADKAIEKKRIMTYEQASEWAQAGMEVGSHSCSHLRMTLCLPEECSSELTRSKYELEQELGTRVESFSYPYGEYNAEVVSRVRAAGYTSAVTTRGGRMRAKDDLFRMRRIGINGERGLLRLLAGIATDYDRWRERRLV